MLTDGLGLFTSCLCFIIDTPRSLDELLTSSLNHPWAPRGIKHLLSRGITTDIFKLFIHVRKSCFLLVVLGFVLMVEVFLSWHEIWHKSICRLHIRQASFHAVNCIWLQLLRFRWQCSILYFRAIQMVKACDTWNQIRAFLALAPCNQKQAEYARKELEIIFHICYLWKLGLCLFVSIQTPLLYEISDWSIVTLQMERKHERSSKIKVIYCHWAIS